MAGALVVSLNIPLLWHHSKDPKASARPLVVFVHNYGGNSHTTKRYSLMLEDLGFSSVSFTLSRNGTSTTRFTWPFNLVMKWAQEIEEVLGTLPETQEKIIYSFSGPGASTFHALAKEVPIKKWHVVGLIFDSGPFMDAWGCTRNLVKDYLKIKNPILRESRLAVMMLMWGLRHDQNLRKSVQKVSKSDHQIPILSLRSLNDRLVPVEKIVEVFRSGQFTNVQAFDFESEHLGALRDHPTEYKEIVSHFLTQFGGGHTL